jgi:dolichol-phosphate mannosyltransferase
MRTVVVLPTYNERDNVRGLLSAVRDTVPAADVLVIDDNSPDGTAELVEATAADLGQIKLVVRPRKRGLGTAYREGFTVALDEGYDIIVSMDVDWLHDPSVLPDLIALIEGGADVAIGSRYVPGGATVDWPLHRRLLSRWGNRYTAFVLRLGINDCTSGYRAYRAAALRAIEPATTTAEGYAFLTELVRRHERHGHTMAETPIVFADRRYGTSKMSTRIILESMLLVTRWGVTDLPTGLRRRRRTEQ